MEAELFGKNGSFWEFYATLDVQVSVLWKSSVEIVIWKPFRFLSGYGHPGV